MASDRKTERPTAARLRRARREGDHAVSAPLVAVGALACFSAFAALAFDALLRDVRELLRAALAGDVQVPVDGIPIRVAWLVAPVVGVAAIGALLIGLWQTGGAFSMRPLAWRWERLSPWAGASPRSLSTRFFSALCLLVLVMLLGVSAWQVLRAAGPALAASVGSANAAASVAIELCRGIVLWALAVTLVVAIGDAVVNRHAWYTRLWMTRDEVRSEQRESEGDAGVKEARRRSHQELAKSQEVTRLEGCNLLVVGQPRLAIALRYDSAHDTAPRVLIQGTGGLAKTLEALAPVYGVPVHHDAALARTLAALPADEEIPKVHYAAVRAALQLASRASARD